MKYLAWLLLVPFCACAQLSGSQAAQRLQLTSQLPASGTFEQQKHMRILKKPFVSKGSYHISDDELVWHTKTPVSQILRYSNDKVTMTDADGSAESVPQARTFARLIRQLMAGDIEALENRFTINAADQPACIALTPTDPYIAQVFTQMQVCGPEAVRSVSMTDTRGSETRILLSPDGE